VRVAIKKVPGVESVDVSLERAVTEIRLVADNSVTLAQLRRIIKASGFNAADATVTAVGTLTDQAGEPAITISGANVTWRLLRDPGHSAVFDEAKQRAASKARVEVRGVVAAPRAESEPAQMSLHALTVR
jgi:copper chaperone CopZ